MPFYYKCHNLCDLCDLCGYFLLFCDFIKVKKLKIKIKIMSKSKSKKNCGFQETVTRPASMLSSSASMRR